MSILLFHIMSCLAGQIGTYEYVVKRIIQRPFFFVPEIIRPYKNFEQMKKGNTYLRNPVPEYVLETIKSIFQTAMLIANSY